MSDWEHFKDRHAGETCWIVGNGPSLSGVDLAALRALPSLGCNRVYVEPRGFVPTYYANVGPEMMAAFGEEPFERLAGRVRAFFVYERQVTPSVLARYPGETIVPLRSLAAPVFSLDPAKGVYEGFTVTFANLQIAHWMGFARALLVGVDHRWIVPAGVNPRRAFLREGPDPNHFCDDYIPEGVPVTYNPEFLAHATNAYGLAAEQYRRDGRMEVLNCTEGSDLKVFPVADWRAFV